MPLDAPPKVAGEVAGETKSSVTRRLPTRSTNGRRVRARPAVAERIGARNGTGGAVLREIMRLDTHFWARRVWVDLRKVSCLAQHFSENHLCGAKELFASPRNFLRIPPPLPIGTLRKSAENPVFSARVSFFCPRLRFFTQDRPFCMARELILATIDD